MLEGSGGVSHGRFVGTVMVVLRCFEQSDGLGSDRVAGEGRIVRGGVHSIVRGVDGSAWGSSRGRPSLLRRGKRVFSSEDGFIIVSGGGGPSFQKTDRWLSSLGSSVGSRGGSVGESLCGYSELSAGRRLLDSQEQPTASVSAVSQEGAPKESQA